MTKPDWYKIAREFLHPTSLEIIDCMTDGERWSAKELSRELREPLGNVSYHVRSLYEHGLLKRDGKPEPRRGAVEKYYRLRP